MIICAVTAQLNASFLMQTKLALHVDGNHLEKTSLNAQSPTTHQVSDGIEQEGMSPYLSTYGLTSEAATLFAELSDTLGLDLLRRESTLAANERTARYIITHYSYHLSQGFHTLRKTKRQLGHLIKLYQQYGEDNVLYRQLHDFLRSISKRQRKVKAVPKKFHKLTPQIIQALSDYVVMQNNYAATLPNSSRKAKESQVDEQFQAIALLTALIMTGMRPKEARQSRLINQYICKDGQAQYYVLEVKNSKVKTDEVQLYRRLSIAELGEAGISIVRTAIEKCASIPSEREWEAYRSRLSRHLERLARYVIKDIQTQGKVTLYSGRHTFTTLARRFHQSDAHIAIGLGQKNVSLAANHYGSAGKSILNDNSNFSIAQPIDLGTSPFDESNPRAHWGGITKYASHGRVTSYEEFSTLEGVDLNDLDDDEVEESVKPQSIYDQTKSSIPTKHLASYRRESSTSQLSPVDEEDGI